MLGQPVYFLTPDVVGVELKGKLPEGCTATDLVLTVTEMLRREKVVGKFVEFFGEGTASLAVPDRATIANMAPEYGATMGFFPVDEATVDYLVATGRTPEEVDAFASYFKAQNLFGIPKAGEIDYTKALSLDLASIKPSLAGPKRPQDRIELGAMKQTFTSLFSKAIAENGFAKAPADLGKRIVTPIVADGVGAISDATPRVQVTAPRRATSSRWSPTGPRWTASTSRPAARVHRQRRRPDRGDHVVHEHVESRRAARRRPARQEGGRARPHGAQAHQDVARAGLARGDRLPDQGGPPALPRAARLHRRRLRLHHVHRQRRRPRARDQRRDRQQRPDLRGRALRQPQLRGAHPSEPQGELPGVAAAGRRLCDRRHRAARPGHRAGRPRQGRCSPCSSRTCGRRRTRSPR